jgi:3-hydroxyisobutyrate dehydrogenase-like beta-hydroxyacid dehydrogenase
MTGLDTPRVGILGLGRLGRALALRLQGEVPLLAYDVDRQAAQEFASRHRLALVSRRELVRCCDVVLITVPPTVVAEVLRRLSRRPGPHPVYANLATGVRTAELLADRDVAKLPVVGLKPVCQFTAVRYGLPTVFVTTSADHLALLQRAVEQLGPVVLGEETVVRRLNRIATKAALAAASELQDELRSVSPDDRLVQAAIRNVFAGTAADYPPDQSDHYATSLLAELPVAGGMR